MDLSRDGIGVGIRFANWGLRRPGKLVLPSGASRMPTDQDEGWGLRTGYARVHSTTYGVIPPSMQNCHLLATPTHGGFTIGGETMDA